MSIYEIRKDDDPVLRELAREIPKINPNIHKLLKDMADTMYEANGVGLAAPQIGISKRAIVINTGEGGIIALLNPEITRSEGEEVAEEGCLSYPGLVGDVKRAAKVWVVGLDPAGKNVDYEAEGLLARVFQHEIDHLNGIVYLDKAVNVHKVK